MAAETQKELEQLKKRFLDLAEKSYRDVELFLVDLGLFGGSVHGGAGRALGGDGKKCLLPLFVVGRK